MHFLDGSWDLAGGRMFLRWLRQEVFDVLVVWRELALVGDHGPLDFGRQIALLK